MQRMPWPPCGHGILHRFGAVPATGRHRAARGTGEPHVRRPSPSPQVVRPDAGRDPLSDRSDCVSNLAPVAHGRRPRVADS